MSNVHTLSSVRRQREDEDRRRRSQYPFGSGNTGNAGYSMSSGYPSRSENGNGNVIGNLKVKKEELLYGMIGINCMAFVGWQVDPRWMSRHFMLSKHNLRRQRYHVLVSSQCSHQGLVHLGFNMYALYHNGLSALHQMKFGKFLMLYVGSGIMANLTTLIWHIKVKKRRDVHALGASGALMGLNVYLGMRAFYTRWKMDEMSSSSETDLLERVKRFVAKNVSPDFLLLILFQFMSREDHAGHLGGAMFGWMFWKFSL